MSEYQLLIAGTAVGADVYDSLVSVEVEEHADQPGAVRIKLPVTTQDADLPWVSDDKLGPFTPIAVVITPETGPNHCIFDGYVLSQRIHLEAGITASTLEVTGQDATVLMQLEEKTREFAGLTHGEVANQLFGEQNFALDPANVVDDSPAATDDTRTLMQRGTDHEFLVRLARRTGRWCRIACNGSPGTFTGTFAVPTLTGDPVVVLDLNDPTKSQVKALDFTWDVARPTTVVARQGSFTASDPVVGDASDSGLAPLDARDLRTFAGRDRTVMLTAAADDAEVPGRARGVLREAGWFARCEGTADLALTNVLLRPADVVAIEGVGKVLSGKYLVKSVRHTITTNSHEMAFTLVRNAVGAPK